MRHRTGSFLLSFSEPNSPYQSCVSRLRLRAGEKSMWGTEEADGS